MKNIYLALSLLLLLSQVRVSGQTQVVTDNKLNLDNGLGVAAGYTTGYGLSYRYQPKKFGVQITFSPYKDSQTTQYSAGLTFLYKLMETPDKSINCFLYESNGYFYTFKNAYYKHTNYTTYNDTTYNYINHTITTYVPHSIKSFMNNGVGVGAEIFLLNGVVLDVMGGYAFYDTFTQYRLTGETCLLFKF